MAQRSKLWEHFVGSQALVDLVILASLGSLTYFVLRHPGRLDPSEAAALVVAFSFLLILGRRLLGWHRRITVGSVIPDWTRAILAGDRRLLAPPPGLTSEEASVVEALNRCLTDLEDRDARIRALGDAWRRDQEHLEVHLKALQAQREKDLQARQGLAGQLEALRAPFLSIFLDQVLANPRFRSDQPRNQGQELQDALEAFQQDAERLEEHLEELKDTFPRLLRDGDTLGRIAHASLRQEARLSMAIQGLSSHAPRLLEEGKERLQQLSRFRKVADELRDRGQSLAHRFRLVRQATQHQLQAFGGIETSLQGIDDVAQQTGLLAVNAAILAHQDRGGGFRTIGDKIRLLSEQTALGTAEVERRVQVHRQHLMQEALAVEGLEEAANALMADLNELLRIHARVDHQSLELERTLESHLALVEQLMAIQEESVVAVQGLSQRVHGIESSLSRQRAVALKLEPELERLARGARRAGDVGSALARMNQQVIQEIEVLWSRHDEIRRSEVFRRLGTGELRDLEARLRRMDEERSYWRQLRWLQGQRPVLGRSEAAPAFYGVPGPEGVRARLLATDALGLPEPSALQRWTLDPGGLRWTLELRADLQGEDHRLALLDALRQGPLVQWLPRVEARLGRTGVDLTLPWVYPNFPFLLAGLGVSCRLAPEGLPELHPPVDLPRCLQSFLWLPPGLGPEERRAWTAWAHGRVQGQAHHDRWMGIVEAGVQEPRLCRHCGEGHEPLPAPEGGPVAFWDDLGEPWALDPWRLALGDRPAADPGAAPTFGTLSLPYAHPEVLLMGLFHPDHGLAGAVHPDLVGHQDRFLRDVLAMEAEDSHAAAWALLEVLEAEGWLLPLPA